jgi:hypothetical protein
MTIASLVVMILIAGGPAPPLDGSWLIWKRMWGDLR